MKRYIVTEKQLKDLARTSRLVGKASMDGDDSKYHKREIEAETQYNEMIVREVPTWAQFFGGRVSDEGPGQPKIVRYEDIPR